MSYQLNFVATLPLAGLTLNAKLYDSAGAQVGATITSGFIDYGDRSYSYWATIPAAHVGSFVMYDSANPTTRAVRFSISASDGASASWDTASSELTSAPSATATYAEILSWLYALSRNKITQTSLEQTLRNSDDTATIARSPQRADATTYIRERWL